MKVSGAATSRERRRLHVHSRWQGASECKCTRNKRFTNLWRSTWPDKPNASETLLQLHSAWRTGDGKSNNPRRSIETTRFTGSKTRHAVSGKLSSNEDWSTALVLAVYIFPTSTVCKYSATNYRVTKLYEKLKVAIFCTWYRRAQEPSIALMQRVSFAICIFSIDLYYQSLNTLAGKKRFPGVSNFFDTIAWFLDERKTEKLTECSQMFVTLVSISHFTTRRHVAQFIKPFNLNEPPRWPSELE